ncbi:hypothetical protein [uncultured Aquimarina sp.]|uniref:hypothetical protein n=1 Tax=uncultured Aquimarina sp. TaxID=575652 RepID=UPI00261C3620|nr:hypothetical protein [uncultured Aquimarina sp.]
MKKNFGNFIFILILAFGQYIFGQNIVGTKSFETEDEETIKLLPDNRVLFEVSERISYPDSTNIIGTTSDGKKICGLRISNVIHQSYGTYEIVDSTLIMDFKYENPIEDLKIISLNEKEKKNKHKLNIIKNLDTNHDLKVYQDDKELCHILWLSDKCKIFIDSTKKPLVFNYNGNLKSITLDSLMDTIIEVRINDLKGNNQIKDERLTFKLNQLTEK